MIITLLIFFIILLALILSHEMGHFFSARFFGIKVEEFGFGIPPRILSIAKDKKGTLYSLNLLPFGGFVKIFGEEGENSDNSHSFSHKPAWARAVVLASGVAANVLLAYFAFILISALGVPESIGEEQRGLYPDAAITIVDLGPSAPAAEAGIQIGDQVKKMKIGNIEIVPQNIEDIQNFTKKNLGQNISMEIQRGNENIEKTILARANSPEGEGPLGVALGYVHLRKSLWYMAPIDGAVFTWQTLKATTLAFGELAKNLIVKKTPGVQIAGPVGIYNITSSARGLGINFLLLLLASLSINLALINILPFPGLDGGRLLFVIIEALRGKRISAQTSAIVHSIGLAILILLMVAVTYHDIAKIL